MKEYFELSRRLLERELPKRWRHVQGVRSRALTAASIFSNSEAEVLANAAILHDVGYSSQACRTGFHALDGAVYLQANGVSMRLCSLVAHHSCAYREAMIRGLSRSLYQWQDERSSLRDALWWADMTTTPEGEVTNIHDRIEEIRNRYGPEDLVTAFIVQAKPELMAAVERTEERLRAAGLGHLAK